MLSALLYTWRRWIDLTIDLTNDCRYLLGEKEQIALIHGVHQYGEVRDFALINHGFCIEQWWIL